MRYLFFFLFSLHLFSAKSQSFFFKYENSIPVEMNGKAFKNAWAGGINAAQVSTIDINNDQKDDLFVFDKTTNKLTTFIATEVNGVRFYKHEPKYELLFPQFTGWVLLADYNCDRKKDIFTYTSGGDVKVYKNITASTGLLQLKLETSAIQTEGLSGFFSLHITSIDLPSIVDIDGDGDLDILTFDSSSGAFVELHRNQSKEKYGHCDSLDFKRIGNCWGNFLEGSNCKDYQFGVDCGSGSGRSGMRILHSGSASLAIDLDGDGDKDLLVGDVGCDNMSMLKNGGMATSANFISATDTFPSSSQAVRKMNFPAPFYEDVDFDGKKDLIVSVNLTLNEGNLTKMNESVWLYKNTGSTSNPSFSLMKKDFLQDEMVDLGEYTYPALADFDGDSDYDLLVGSRGKIEADGTFYAKLYYFENAGNREAASFKLKDNDFLGLSSSKFTNLKPYFQDLNKDNKLDLVYVATNPNTTLASIAYILNTSSNGSLQFQTSNTVDIDMNFNDYDSPYLVDKDNDGDLDLLVGKTQGRLEYYQNTGTNLNPLFSLVDAKLGGIDNSLTNKNIYPLVADLNKDGNTELILTDRSGNFKIFQTWNNNLSDSFINSPEFLLNENTNKYIAPNFGREIFPAVADLDHDGLLDLVLGTNAGGLIYLKNDHLINGMENENKKIAFNIHPNPAKDHIFIETSSDGQLEIYSLLGQKITTSQIKGNLKAELNLSHLNSGVYIIRLLLPSGSSVAKKIMIE